MPRCPSCGKGGFPDHEAIARHMSQPKSGCSTWFDDLVHIREDMLNNRNHDGSTDPCTASIDEQLGGRDGYDPWIGGDQEMSDGTREENPDFSFIEYFPGAAQTYKGGSTFINKFDADEFGQQRSSNIYYPFASRGDWELGSWLLRSGLSMGAIDVFLSLDLVRKLPLSFHTAKELRGRAELLPGGPRWKVQELHTSHPTKRPVLLYWRDSLELVQSLLNNPGFRNAMDLSPFHLYDSAERLYRVYTEWMSGEDAWSMQSQIPAGATLLGTILSSDKTTISVLTGDRVAHPLLISLASIKMATRLKLSSHAFLLTALLPVPKFVHKNKRMKGVLEARLIHQCLDIVLEPLKQATKLGVMLSDPWGYSRYCFTPIASYIVDTPEAAMLAVVGGKTSPITMATYKQFGDNFQHEPRTSSTTLAQLAVVSSTADPNDIEVYFREAQKFHLNSVDKPFWRDIALSCPSKFLTPEVLHHIHKQFGDHDAKWCINALGPAEIDFRFSVLQPITGFRHFKEGISTLKQVTGRTLRDIQCFIVGVIAGGAPRDVVIAVRALMDFRYHIQAYRITDGDIEVIVSALHEFHSHKHSILDTGLRRGKANKPIDNWYIPKLELMQSVAPSIRRVGVSIQWSADLTEHAHIEQIKDPTRSSNNNNYDPQICRQLDRLERCRNFDLAMSIKDPAPRRDVVTAATDDRESDDEQSNPHAGLQTTTDYFARSRHLALSSPDTIPFLVAAEEFSLPDLRGALADFLSHEKIRGVDSVHPIGGGPRRAAENAELPFEHIQIWFKLRLQTVEVHTNSVLPAQTIFASPPKGDWQYGRYDSVVVNTDRAKNWPASGLQGHCIVQLRLIMRPLGKAGEPWPWGDRFLSYVQRFDIVPQAGALRDPSTQMHILKRAMRSNGQHLGDVIAVSRIRAYANLIPRFGQCADARLTSFNSFEHCREFLLNKYFDKNSYYPLSL
ncbi:hypothetical protein EDD15DRAFT_2373187 [Pisolithus albus]|nr:hypothetical protein EDD15DRAFT_2373187 [Pisolithus albus]